MKKFLMVLLSIAFVLNLAIVIGLIGGYGSPRRALYTICLLYTSDAADEL